MDPQAAILMPIIKCPEEPFWAPYDTAFSRNAGTGENRNALGRAAVGNDGEER